MQASEASICVDVRLSNDACGESTQRWSTNPRWKEAQTAKFRPDVRDLQRRAETERQGWRPSLSAFSSVQTSRSSIPPGNSEDWNRRRSVRPEALRSRGSKTCGDFSPEAEAAVGSPAILEDQETAPWWPLQNRQRPQSRVPADVQTERRAQCVTVAVSRGRLRFGPASLFAFGDLAAVLTERARARAYLG